MNENVLRKLICPDCGLPRLSRKTLSVIDGQSEIVGSEQLQCISCLSVYPNKKGIIDFTGMEPSSRKPSQWAMEFQPLVALYEKIWRPMVTKPFSDLKWEMDAVQKFLNMVHGIDVLDLGCGPGNFSRLIARAVNPGLVIGFDLSLPMLKQGLKALEKTEASNITLMRGDVTRWPFAKAGFERIHCSGALHLFPKLNQVFASVFDTLKPGGLFVGATYCRGGGYVKRKIQNYISSTYGFHWFDIEELQHLAEDSGFVGWRHFIRKQGIVFCVSKPGTAA